ncbi:MAG: insulinase family protein [Parvibaculaceae bacterium]|nr:insulinase family protein [Parvibaculaceae bacterium]
MPDQKPSSALKPVPMISRFGFHFFVGLIVFAAVVLTYRGWSNEVSEPEGLSTVEPQPVSMSQTFTLENGLKVVVLPDHRAPVVTHMVWYNVGASDEPAGKSGIAHFLEHLMFKGTKKIAPGELSKIVARNGGQDNAFTSQDYTGYFQRVAKDRLSLVMEMEADRMTNLVLTDAEVLPERDVVLEERRARTDNNPSALLGEQMSALQYPNHPYGIPVIGWPDEIAALTTEDAIAFYRAHYSPENAILVVAGDVTSEELRPLAEKFYGSIAQTGDVKPRVRSQPVKLSKAQRVVREDARARQPSLSRTYSAPNYHVDHAQGAALELMTTIFGGGATSTLYRRLVVEEQVAAAAGAWYQSGGLDAGRLGVYAVPRPGVSLEDLEAALDKALADFIATSPEQEQLDRAKSLLLAQTIYSRDNQQDMARLFGSTLTSGGTVAEIENWEQEIRKVDLAAIQKAAQSAFDLTQSVTGWLQPAQVTAPTPTHADPITAEQEEL